MKIQTLLKVILGIVLIEFSIAVLFFFIGYALHPGMIDETVINVITSDEELVAKSNKAIVHSNNFDCKMSIDFKNDYNVIWRIPSNKTEVFKSNKIDKFDITLTDTEGKNLCLIQDIEVNNFSPFKEMYSIEINSSEVIIQYYYKTEYVMIICMCIVLVVYLLIIKRRFSNKTHVSEGRFS